MENYIEKHINEGFNIRNRVLTFTDDNENILNTSLDGPSISETIYNKDLNKRIIVYSIFTRIKQVDNNYDSNPVLYALKGEKNWQFSSPYNQNIFWERFSLLLHKFLSDHKNNFETTIVIPSSNKLNRYFSEEVKKYATEVGIKHIISGGLRTISTESVEDACYETNSFFRNYRGDKWEDKLDELREYLDKMDRENNGLFKYHLIDMKSGLRPSIIRTLEVDKDSAFQYREFINSKNVLLLDDSITHGQTINNAIYAISQAYHPKTVSVLTMFSRLTTGIYKDFSGSY